MTSVRLTFMYLLLPLKFIQTSNTNSDVKNRFWNCAFLDYSREEWKAARKHQGQYAGVSIEHHRSVRITVMLYWVTLRIFKMRTHAGKGVKLTLCLFWYHAKKTYEEMEEEPHAILTSVD